MFESGLFADWDLLMAGVRHWWAGGNPYGPYPHEDGLHEAGAFAYPPPALTAGAPFAVLPEQISGLLWLLVSITIFELWVRATSRRVGMLWLLLWLPLNQNMILGQTTLAVLALLGLAELAAAKGHDRRAGLLLALAIIKPQIIILPALWMLLVALRQRRWRFLSTFGLVSLALWISPILLDSPRIYWQWYEGLQNYNQNLPDRPLLFPPLGPLLALLSFLLWRRHGHGDTWGLLLLLNTLLYPLSVVYVASAIAFVVIRWRPDWPWYPLPASWLIPVLLNFERMPSTISAVVQAIVATGLLAGLAPRLLPPRTEASTSQGGGTLSAALSALVARSFKGLRR